jgi:hypothetical protein
MIRVVAPIKSTQYALLNCKQSILHPTKNFNVKVKKITNIKARLRQAINLISKEGYLIHNEQNWGIFCFSFKIEATT